MGEARSTLLWISGATEGIGLGLARNAPYPGARIINLSRRRHPQYESIALDLADPSTWDRARESFRRELTGFAGRAIFVHNAFYSEAVGLVGRLASGAYEKSVLANVAAPLVLAEAFISACPPDIDAGLVMMSSGSAATPLEGLATYCAAKIAIEHWVEVVQRERESRGGRPWVVAVRPGGVDTAPARAAAALSPEVYPRAAAVTKAFDRRLDIDTAARRIWSALPPDPETAVIAFEGAPAGASARFGDRLRLIDEAEWRAGLV